MTELSARYTDAIKRLGMRIRERYWHSVKPQVNRPTQGSRLPAEASAAWWSPRSSNSVSAVQSGSQASFTRTLLTQQLAVGRRDPPVLLSLLLSAVR
jgi:hypothetical protein